MYFVGLCCFLLDYMVKYTRGTIKEVMVLDSKISILIVEDDAEACRNFRLLCEEYSNMEIVAVTESGTQALEYIITLMPDVVILDLELQSGQGSGVSVLFELKKRRFEPMPYILVTTNNSSAVTLNSVRSMGADYIISKHQQNYSEKDALDLIYMLAPVIKADNQRKSPVSDISHEGSLNRESNEKRLRRMIFAELDKVGVSPKAVGYKYLADAIYLNIQEPTQNICSVIGRKYKKTASSVERAMQNAINRAWTTGDIDALLQNYTAGISSAKGVPTLTEFIFYYVNKLNNL